jgi:hypothetical protein
VALNTERMRIVRMNIHQPIAARVSQLLRLTLSTNRDGEALAGLAASRRTLEATGLDIHAVADAVEAGLGRSPAPFHEPDWRSTARFCRSRPDLLNEREARFIATIMKRDQPLSPKQQKWLSDIESRLRGWL